MSRLNPQVYEFGRFRLDAKDHLLLREGKPVPLTPKVFETLLVLVQNRGRVVEKESLIRALWPDTFVEDNNLAVNISMLRKALGDQTNGDHYIENIPKRGYRFVASIREVWEADDESQAINGQATTEALSAPQEAVTPNKVINSLAVLPLVNGTADANAEYLSDGITESIINRLSQLPQLRVMARSTVFRYKGRDIDPQEAGREMNVRAVLTGRLLQLGDSLIIRTELTDIADGSHLWGEQYDRKPADLLAVQEEISWEISEKLRLKLSGDQIKQLTKRYTESTEAYRTYLKGRYYWNKRTPDGLKKGIEYFEQAIHIDPNYALAYAGLADSYLLLGSVEYSALDPQVARQHARKSALEALRIDNSLSEAHASLAYVKMFDWDWTDALREFSRAIELNPGYATAHHWYALYLMAMNNQAEASAEIETAREIDPLSLPIIAGVGWHFYLTRQYTEAIEECRRALEMDSNFYMAHFVRGLSYVQLSRYAEALEEYGQGSRLSGDTPLLLAAQGHVFALLQRIDETEKVLDELFRMSRRRYVSPYYIAVIYTGLGEVDKAFEWLERACESHSEGLMWLKVDPTIDRLRLDDRFTNLVRRVGLAP
ncbi:MAG TPA: winged helix-turn-helix domain-containing protein [Pyrinomonadaceae bacterium]